MLLEVRDLTADYEGSRAVRGVSLELREGSIVALIGANGAGKTTILRVISGLKRATSGAVLFEGRRIDGLQPEQIARLGLGHCPEGKGLFPFMTVSENVRMGAYSRKDGDRIEADLEATFERFPRLRERSHQRARTLSGGEQTMVAIARALMSRPRLLLLDEPSLGLSPVMVDVVADIVAEIRSSGVSVVLVEQNSALALELADYGYVLENGSLALQGPVAELRDNPHVKRAYLGL